MAKSEKPECTTCEKRIADYKAMVAEGLKLVDLGRAYCQECGGRYTAYAERSDD